MDARQRGLRATISRALGADPHAEQIGRRLIGPLALARSLDREHDGSPREALAVLTGAFGANPEELVEIEDLLADAARLAAGIADLSTADAVAGRAAALAAGSAIPHRPAAALYCRGLLDHDATRLLAAAERYADASRPLMTAKALEAAAAEFVRADDRDQARAAFARAVDAYTALGAAADVARLQAAFRAHGIRRAPHASSQRARHGWDSLSRPRSRSRRSSRRGCPTPRSAPSCCSPRGLSRPTSPMS